MPSILSHGIIGYLLFGGRGLVLAILPDLIGNAFFTLKTIIKYDTYNPFEILGNTKHTDFDTEDYTIYRLSHSLLLWLLILLITKDKAVYAAIIAICMDVFLHDNKTWKGPEPFYPINNFRFDGINWSSKSGMMITISIIIILLISSDIRNKIKNNLVI